METKKSTHQNNDPFAGCILTEQVRSGKAERYSYAPNGLPKLRTKSGLGWSPFFEKMDTTKKAKTTKK